MRDDTVCLRHISQSAELIAGYLSGADGVLNQDMFYDDLRTQDAVLRRLETLADAASHLSNALKARYPEIRWSQITDFRNALAHGYTDIRLDRVWRTIAADLPALRALADHKLGHLPSSA